MLTFELIGNCAGVILFNDYLSLRQMHRIVHDVNERSTNIRDKEGFFVGFAYDLRKAYEGQRRNTEPDKAQPYLGPRFGVEILWPVLLVQSRQLRDSLSFIDHTKEHQAMAWELESVIEQAIETEFENQAAEIKTEWERLSTNQAFVEENAMTRAAQFAAWGNVERREGLAGLLASLNPMYSMLYPLWVRNGAKDRHLVAPADFEVWKEREFPDPGFGRS